MLALPPTKKCKRLSADHRINFVKSLLSTMYLSHVIIMQNTR